MRSDGSQVSLWVTIEPQVTSQGKVQGGLFVGRLLNEESGQQHPDRRRDFVVFLVHELGLSPISAYTYEQGLRRIERWTSNDAAEVTVTEARHYRRMSPHHPATKNATVVALKAYTRYLLADERHPDVERAHAILSLRGPKMVREPREALTDQEAALLIDAARSPAEKRLIYLGLMGGLRLAESTSIDDSHWRPSSEVVGFGKLRFVGKGRKTREVPIIPALAKQRLDILSRRPSYSSLKAAYVSLSHYTGITFTSHTLRHTFGRHLVRRRASRDVSGAILGHGPLTVTTAYYMPVEFWEMCEVMATLDYRKEQ